MKRALVGAVIVSTVVLINSSASADYVIKLKNGRTVETAGYSEEQNELKFQWQDGFASLSRKDVVSIREVEEKIPAPVYKEKEPLPAGRESAPEMRSEAKKDPEGKALPGRQAKEKEIDPVYYKKQKAQYTEQFEQAYQRYLDAASRKDNEGKQKAWEEFNRYGGQVVSLEAELKKKNDGVVPSWWKE